MIRVLMRWSCSLKSRVGCSNAGLNVEETLGLKLMAVGVSGVCELISASHSLMTA